MFCAYHSKNTAVVDCHRCARSLCTACDHRIRGFPYCQDCIVAGVEVLQRQTRSDVLPEIRRNTSPLVATLLSFVPGLGAAYNGQTSKAIVHFAVFASFFQLAIVTQSVEFGLPLFVAGFFGTWLFSAVDAYRTAQLLRSGLVPDTEQDVIARRLYGSPLAWSITLMVLGAIFLVHTLMGIRLPIRQVLPVLLIMLGAYMLVDYLMGQRRRASYLPALDANPQIPAVVPANSGRFQTGELISHVSTSRSAAPFPFEQRP
ncbi:MAG TPA: hypothetical protein VM095_11195 [Pyrinomonadaceae bacterium]|nr:hypothetical protein [Pyrinomonadaceae bacterium]